MQHAAIGLGSKAIHTARGRFIAVRSHATALAMDEASALEVRTQSKTCLNTCAAVRVTSEGQ